METRTQTLQEVAKIDAREKLFKLRAHAPFARLLWRAKEALPLEDFNKLMKRKKYSNTKKLFSNDNHNNTYTYFLTPRRNEHNTWSRLDALRGLR